MSLFLLPQAQFVLGTNTKGTHELRYGNSQKFKSQPRRLGDIIKNQLKSLKECVLKKSTFKNYDQHYALKIFELGFDLKALFSVKTTKNNNQISFVVQVLGPDSNYYKTNNRFQTTQICRNIMVEHSSFQQNMAFIKMNPDTRQIKLQLPLFLNCNQSVLGNSCKTVQVIRLVMLSILQPHLNLISDSLKNILRVEGRGRAKDLALAKPNKALQKINRYSLISNVSTRIPCHPQLQSKKIITQFQKQTLKKLIKSKVNLRPQLPKTAQLFGHSHIQDSQIRTPIEQININEEQRFMKSKISIAVPASSQLPQQNFLIENRIELVDAKNLQLQKIGEGGFATLYLAHMNFWYPQVNDKRTLIPKKETDLIQTKLVLKVQLPSMTQFYQNQEDLQAEKSRKQHEIRIIQKMKKGKSIYLPKYYFPNNLHKQKNCHLNNSLLMEYIPFKSLAELLESSGEYLSLQSKLHLMLSTCQGLRYLRDLDIVHLDLKPNNIMNFYHNYVKLIDFGQSYHPEVCDAGYKPGFTIPYSAPEIFSDKEQLFTSKSDVFSFGVICYQMLFKKMPFSLKKDTDQYEEQMKKCLEYWYYSPEQCQSYGEGEVIRILVGLISRCLLASPQDRPELDWIALVLKLSLEIVN